MIQVIMKDGNKHRFTKKIEGINIADIAYQLEFDEKDIAKIPEIKNGELILREKTQAEKDAEKILKKQKEIKVLKYKKIKLKSFIDAGNALGEDMSKEEIELASL